MRNALLLPELEIIIEDSLGYTISIFGWLLPEDHKLYLKGPRTYLARVSKEVKFHFRSTEFPQ